MSDFVDPRFVDLLMLRLNETETRLKEVIVTGGIDNFNQYQLLRGQIEGVQFAKRDIEEIVEKIFVEE
ncbi:MAG: hypothetical protein GOVbin152_52 [Prokaryotic dsDNA virus sp.]|nr:MAG: hypothetical protein GOVbin152_52 [Prokaryotic dsDNA virus sp.]